MVEGSEKEVIRAKKVKSNKQKEGPRTRIHKQENQKNCAIKTDESKMQRRHM